MRVASYVLRRLIFLFLVLFGVSLITFTISHVVPGDPAQLVAGPHAKPETVQAIRAQLGLDQPLPTQYIRYISGVLHGDLGMSLHSHRAVAKDLAEFFPATFELTFFSIVLALLIGLPLGIICSVRKDKLADHISRFVALTGVAMPSFWLGLMLLLVFYLGLGILPGGGRLGIVSVPPRHITGLYVLDSLLTGNFRTLGDSLQHLILPAVCEATVCFGMVTRMTRSSMLEVLRQDYVRTAKAKGMREKIVIYRHAFRNALLPVITLLGMMFGSALGGAVLTETIFSWPGIGRYAVRAIMFLDFPAVMGVTLMVAFIYVLANLVVDVAYFYIDPRIKSQ